MMKIFVLATVLTVALAQHGYFIRGYGGHGSYRRPSYAPSVGYSAPHGGLGIVRGHGGYAPRLSNGYSGGHAYAPHNDYSQPIPYEFGYNVHGDHGDQQSRREAGDGHGNVQGSYGYRDAYGLYRQVDYVADHYGFRANVKTNEPGTANQNPADVNIQSDQSPHYGRY